MKLPKITGPEYTPKELETEVWKDLPGYEELYMVSNIGRLFSKERVIERLRFGKVEKVPKKGSFVNATLDSSGYPQVKLYRNGKNNSFKLHRLVALAFLENPNNLPLINHIDGNKQNARLSNLERCTARENTRHAWKTGLCVSFKGEDQNTAKLRNADIPVIRAMISAGAGATEIGRKFGVTGACIYYIAKGTTWRHVV